MKPAICEDELATIVIENHFLFNFTLTILLYNQPYAGNRTLHIRATNTVTLPTMIDQSLLLSLAV